MCVCSGKKSDSKPRSSAMRASSSGATASSVGNIIMPKSTPRRVQSVVWRPWETARMLDERLVKALHVSALREQELHAEHEPHVLFQASTIGALLDGAYEGDVTFAEVVSDQRVFDLKEVEGTMVGFRFPDYAEGIEVSGYHLHFISADRARGGHVLECRPRQVVARIDASTDLHVELPPGVDLSSPQASRETHEALNRAEHWG